jgi:hypothetical protein
LHRGESGGRIAPMLAGESWTRPRATLVAMSSRRRSSR